MRQIGTLDGGWFSIHETDTIEKDDLCTELDLKPPGQECIRRHDGGLNDLAGDIFAEELHLLGKAEQILRGLVEPGIDHESPHARDSPQDAVIDQFADGMTDGISPNGIFLT